MIAATYVLQAVGIVLFVVALVLAVRARQW